MNRRVTPRLTSKRNRRRKPRPLYCVRIHDGFWPTQHPDWHLLSRADQGERMFQFMGEIQRQLNGRSRKHVTLFAHNQFIDVIRVEHFGDVIVTAIPEGPMADALNRSSVVVDAVDRVD